MDNFPYLNEAVRNVLVKLRREAGLSQQKLANFTTLTRVYILQLEQGKFRPTLNSVFHIARGLGTTPQALIDLIEEERLRLEQQAENNADKL